MATRLSPAFAQSARALPKLQIPQALKDHVLIDPEKNKNLMAGDLAVKNFMENAYNGAEKINSRRALTNPRITPQTNFDQIEQQIEDYRRNNEQAYARARTSIDEAIVARQSQLDAKAGIKETADAKEIRMALLLTPPNERLSLLENAAKLESADQALLGAVAGKSRVLTGIEPALVDAVVNRFRTLAAPEERKALDDSIAYRDMLEMARVRVIAFGYMAFKGFPDYAEKRTEGVAILRSFDPNYEYKDDDYAGKINPAIDPKLG